MRTHAPASKSASARSDVSAPALHPAFAPAPRRRATEGAGHDFARVAVSAPPSPSAPIQRQDDDRPLKDKLPKNYLSGLLASTGLAGMLKLQRDAVHRHAGPHARGFETSFSGILRNLHRFRGAPRPIKAATGLLAAGGAGVSYLAEPDYGEHWEAAKTTANHYFGKYFGKKEE